MSVILACDTTQTVASAALFVRGKCFARFDDAPKGAAESLMPMVEDLFAQARLAPRETDALVATCGPGGFNGVRIGLAAMHGLAIALNKPLFGFGTLHALALAQVEQEQENARDVLVAVDARREVFYTQFFDTRACALSEAQALRAEEIIALAKTHKRDFDVVGSGKHELCALHKGFYESTAPDYPQAALIARAASGWDMANVSEEKAALAPEPIYLRPADARLPDKRKALPRV